MFAMQTFMTKLGAQIADLAPGETDLVLPYRVEFLQQHGFFHGGLVATLADMAAGCAAITLFDEQSGPLTSEFKINFLAPAKGERLLARGRVIKPGKTLNVVQADVYGIQEEIRTHVAASLVTIMRLEGLNDPELDPNHAENPA